MIAANELRVGNWIRLHVAGPKRVAAIKQANVEFENVSTDNFHDYSILHGIPLTPETLEKCGYGRNITGTAWWRDEEKVLIGEKDGKYYFAEWGGYSDEPTVELNIELTALHQLQNLYFALTGKELEVQL